MARPQGGAALQKAAGPDKREIIISSALDLFRHYGYRRTSMEDIARAARERFISTSRARTNCSRRSANPLPRK
ncbi:TetR family transcriptional regulator [Parvibaculum sp.]|uniref:TetR family transcriptional regulator n=1 Tax=Parvibaculum sp. TaxID=2024848 RepID=UPI003412B0CE